MNPTKMSPRTEELSRLIRNAALTIDPSARLKPLADMTGLKPPAIRLALRRGYFTDKAACALELAFGRDLLPKEILCPAKFSV